MLAHLVAVSLRARLTAMEHHQAASLLPVILSVPHLVQALSLLKTVAAVLDPLTMLLIITVPPAPD